MLPHDREHANAKQSAHGNEQPIPCWRYVGDGAFLVGFDGDIMSGGYSPTAAWQAAERLVTHWRKENAPNTVGSPIAIIHQVGYVNAPGQHYEVEIDGVVVGQRHDSMAAAEQHARGLLARL